MSAKENGFHDVACGDDFEEIEIPVPWGHIAGKWWGPRDKQPVLAIHGWQDNAGTFDNLAPILRDNDIPILCIDLPGHGFSSHLPQGQHYYLFWDGIYIIRRIVKHFNWDKITIIGHSLGGAIAFLYAGAYPYDVAKYVSIDIASPSVRNVAKMVGAVGAGIDTFLKYETLTLEKMPRYEKEEMLDIVQEAYKNNLDREGCEIMMRRGMKPIGDSERYSFTRDPRLKVASLGFMSLEQILEFASRTVCEVLNIRGDPGLKFDNPEHYNVVLDKIGETAKRLERHLVPGTHHLHLNDAETVAEIIVPFLKS